MAVMGKIVTKLDITYDVARLWQECSDLIKHTGWGPTGQISLKRRATIAPDQGWFDGVGSLFGTTMQERDFMLLHERCQNTYLDDVLRNLPFQIGRLRIMRVKGRTCYSVHRDTSMRLHLPLLTNPQALMLFPDHAFIMHIPANGHVYLVDTQVRHTAMNGSLDDRYHLVGALCEA